MPGRHDARAGRYGGQVALNDEEFASERLQVLIFDRRKKRMNKYDEWLGTQTHMAV